MVKFINKNTIIILNLIIIASMFVVGLVLYPHLPELLPIHWNIQGQIDRYQPKQQAIWLLPLIILAMFVLFQFLPKLDPKKDAYKTFEREWGIIQTALIGFFAYLHFIIFYLALNPEASMLRFVFIGLGGLFIILGSYMSKIKQNYFVGIRVPWTLASQDNWNKTHQFAKWSMMLTGIIVLVEAFWLWNIPYIIFSSMIVGVLLPAAYSFIVYKQMGDG